MNVKFVSHKISRIRWEPVAQNSLKYAETFSTGSWDDVINRVSIWQLKPVDKNQPTDAADNEPVLLCDAIHHGDIMDLLWIDGGHVVVASSTGSVLLFKYDRDNVTIKEVGSWKSIHHHPSGGAQRCPCTFVTSSHNNVVVSGGEDGRLNVMDVDSGVLTRVVDDADSCTMTAGIFTKQDEVVTANSVGQLKVWDLRVGQKRISRIFSRTNELTAMNCIDKHPHQPHLLVTGAHDGSVCVWDMRRDNFPLTIMEAHKTDVWDIQFHPTYPDSLFTCSEDGSVWHWDGSGVGPVSYSSASTPGDVSRKHGCDTTSPWLASEASKHRLDITNLIPDNTMPINSLSVDCGTLLCGSDGEAIFTIPALNVR